MKMKRTSKNIITPEKLSLVLNSLQCLQTDERFETMIVPIIERSSTISLRTLEHFVLSYAKRFRVSFRQSDQSVIFYYPDYKANLTSFPKKLFDPFGRTEEDDKIMFSYGSEGKLVCTTVGQLNFFKWALQFRLIEYVQAHLSEIEHDKKEWKLQRKREKQAVLESLSSSPDDIVSIRRKRKQPQQEWPIHGIDSPSIPTHGWHSNSPSSVE